MKIKKMISWGNSSEKALNALGTYVKRNVEKKNTETLNAKFLKNMDWERKQKFSHVFKKLTLTLI